jgi:hypothetical protein
MIGAAQKFLQVIMLRRTKAEVDETVPPKEELTIYLPLSVCAANLLYCFQLTRLVGSSTSVLLCTMYRTTYRLLKRKANCVAVKQMDISIDVDVTASLDSVLRTVQELAIRSFKDAPGRWKKLVGGSHVLSSSSVV